MKNRKLNVDRPNIDSKEIQAGMNFGQLMVSYQALSKPFYKSNWFFGTTGLASIGLIVGGTLALQSSDETNKASIVPVLTDAPPELVVEENSDLALTVIADETTSNQNENKLISIPQKKLKNDKTNTLISDNQNQLDASVQTVDVVKNDFTVASENSTNDGNSTIDLTPRINGKLNGNITREDLLDNKGITTGTDVSIIHFELHLIDGLGGRVFEEESNQLNQEMRSAVHNISKGETIYFENIKGKTADGRVVRLNPLRYVLLN